MMDGAVAGGVAFDLAAPARDSRTVSVGVWSVTVLEGQSSVVAWGGSASSYEDVLRVGSVVTQQALDLMSVEFGDNLGVKASGSEHVVWWLSGGVLTVRVVATLLMTMDAKASGVALDLDGTIILPNPLPVLPWHESYRYFRLSQFSDDLFNAYRNAYLALESVLSDFAPQKLKPNGKPSEGEGVWFLRALTEVNANLLKLADFTPLGTTDDMGYLYNELFRDMRSAMSHAKSGRKVLLPQTEEERSRVLESLARLISLYLKLAEAHLSLNRKSGGLTNYGFQLMHAELLDKVEVYACSGSMPELNDTEFAVSEASFVKLQADSGPISTVAFEAEKTWRLRLSGPVTITGFVGMLDGVLGQTAELLGTLSLAGDEWLEMTFVHRGRNAREPRRSYAY